MITPILYITSESTLFMDSMQHLTRYKLLAKHIQSASRKTAAINKNRLPIPGGMKNNLSTVSEKHQIRFPCSRKLLKQTILYITSESALFMDSMQHLARYKLLAKRIQSTSPKTTVINKNRLPIPDGMKNNLSTVSEKHQLWVRFLDVLPQRRVIPSITYPVPQADQT
ncbi:hypothetical protein CDAR_382041 [Caerostris darwini]|uniref:Uncharacterized protein n=1 Tax=Caerostris darwini TaxID=1538125 RepID=A0AAV4V4V8_9ARAC|nr:hypothetical protein CDAR_382041 [Caerostris darwini]